MNKLNYKIEITEKEILKRKMDLITKKKEIELDMITIENRLEEEYKQDKVTNLRYSNADKRKFFALNDPTVSKLNEEIADEDYAIKVLEIELNTLKRQFRILELETDECSSLKTIAVNLKRIADLLEKGDKK